MRFEMPALSGPRRTSEPEVGDARAHLLRDHIGLVQHQHGALRSATRGGHLAIGRLEIHDPRPHLGDARLGHHQCLPEAVVEALGRIAHQLDVLALVLAHRDLMSAIGQDVGGLEHRVEEQPGRDEVALGAGLLLELGHAVELAEGGHRRQQPAQLGVLLDV